MRRRAVKALIALFPLLLALPVHADWQLDPGQSRVQASITQLNGEAPQTHHHQVRDLQGDISSDGTLRLPLKLSQTDVLERFGELPPWVGLLANTTLVTLEAQMPPERLDGKCNTRDSRGANGNGWPCFDGQQHGAYRAVDAGL